MDKQFIEKHRSWQKRVGIAPPESGEYLPIFISHGKFPNHGDHLYGVRLHGNPDQLHNLLDTLHIPSLPTGGSFASSSVVPFLQKANPELSGGNWITLHPHGEGHEGVPVYIVPNGDGSHTVVGGAGSKLNGLKLSKVKSAGEYAKMSAEQSKAQREKQKQLRAEQAAQMGEQAYKEMLDTMAANKSRRDSEKIASGRDFVREVLQAQGINPAQVLDVPDEVIAGADPNRKTQIEKAHVKGLVSYARSVTADLRDKIITALETSSPELGDVQFSDLVRETLFPQNPGYTVSSERMAVDRGVMPSKATLEALGDESRLLRHGDVESAARAKAYQQKLQAGAEKARQEIKTALAKAGALGSGPLASFADNSQPIDLQSAVRLLSLERGLRELDQVHKEEVAGESRGDLNGKEKPLVGSHSPLVVSDKVDEGLVVQDLLDQSRTESMVKFLQTAADFEDSQGSFYGSYSRGRHEALMSHVGSFMPGLTLDPAVGDLLGSVGAAKLLVSTLRVNKTPEALTRFADHMKKTHVGEQKALVDDAIAFATPLVEEGTKEIQVDNTSPSSVLAAYAQLSRQRAILQTARERLGETKGKIEARASLNFALGDKNDTIESILPMSLSDAAVHCAGILGSRGLMLGEDYGLVSGKSGETVLTVTPEGTNKLKPQVSPELARRLSYIQDPQTPTDHPVGFRRELDAKSPLHEVATKGTGELTNRDVSILRRYWAESKGLGNDDEPASPLGASQRAVWDAWQDLATSGHGYAKFPGVMEAQALIAHKLPELGGVDLNSPVQVLNFARVNAQALGYDVLGDHVLGLDDVPEKKALSGATQKIARLVRSIWSDQQGAPEFDPEEIPSVSRSWSNFIRSQGSFNRAVAGVQQMMLSDQSVTEGRGKAFELSPAQQRARGIIGGTGRMALALGAGSGKTATAFASYLDARRKYNESGGQEGAKRALMLVPSAVQGQFGSEWNRFVDPSIELTVHARPGASREEREAAMRGDDVVVMTPEGFRDTLLGAIARRAGETPDVTSQRLKTMPESAVDAEVHGVMENEGWNFDYHLHDEGHRLLYRQGKEDSLMAILADSSARFVPQEEVGSGKLPHYVFATADVTKSDPTEAWGVLHKISPRQYPVEGREAWLRQYRTDNNGNMTEAAGLALRMEMMPYVYTDKTPLDVDTLREDVVLKLTPEEQAQHDQVMMEYKRAKGGQPSAVMGTDPRLFALKRDNLISKIVAHSPNGARANYLAQELRDNPAPTIIFATSRDSVAMLHQKLKDEGHSVVSLTGSDSGNRKKRIVGDFQKGRYDVLVASDAAEAGLNIQRATRVINYDSPMTAKTLEQRIARAHRFGQTSDVTVKNLVADCEWDRRNHSRVKRKGGLREIMTTPLELADDSGHHFWQFAETASLGGSK